MLNSSNPFVVLEPPANVRTSSPERFAEDTCGSPAPSTAAGDVAEGGNEGLHLGRGRLRP